MLLHKNSTHGSDHNQPQTQFGLISTPVKFSDRILDSCDTTVLTKSVHEWTQWKYKHLAKYLKALL